MMRLRPWPLATAGMARSLGTWFILPELVGLVIAGDRRWSSARIVLRSLFGANAGETTRRIGNALAESLRVLFKPATTFLPFDWPGLSYRCFIDLAGEIDDEMRLLQRFRLQLLPGWCVDRSVKATLTPKGGAPMVIKEQDRAWGHGVDTLRGNIREMVVFPVRTAT